MWGDVGGCGVCVYICMHSLSTLLCGCAAGLNIHFVPGSRINLRLLTRFCSHTNPRAVESSHRSSPPSPFQHFVAPRVLPLDDCNPSCEGLTTQNADQLKPFPDHHLGPRRCWTGMTMVTSDWLICWTRTIWRTGCRRSGRLGLIAHGLWRCR